MGRNVFVALLASLLIATVAGNGTQYGLLPGGDLTTSDQDGPYNIPQVQAATVQAAIAAKRNYTDKDVLDFLTNTECLESIFDTYATFGDNIPDELHKDVANQKAIGGRRANLSNEVQAYFEEVALDEQGHVRFIREVLGDRSLPCPTVNIDTAFADFFDAALNRTANPPNPRFNPYANDVNFLLSTWLLEEIGATGDKGSIALTSNPGVADGIAGLAGGASYQAAIDRHLIWQRRNETVQPYGVPVWSVVSALSNFRDALDGPLDVDQGIYNTDLNNIAVPTDSINLVPTDIRGLTFARTPQQVLNILTLGSGTGRGGFFPNGVNGRINSPAGFADQANGFAGYPNNTFTVISLQDAGKANLLNNGTIIPAPANSTVQFLASGREYGSEFLNASTTDYSATYGGLTEGMDNVGDETYVTDISTYDGSATGAQPASGRKLLL